MDKGIGFSRTITLEWLDATAAFCLQGYSPTDMRERLADTIADTVQGADAQRKTIDVLLAIWVKTAQTIPQIRQEALELLPSLSTREERLWLHYGMALAYYPIFRKCTATIGQISRTEDLVTRKMVKERVAGDFGHLGALDRSIERINASLTNWGILVPTEQKQYYQIQFRKYTVSRTDLQIWLLTCALTAHPADGLPFSDLIRLPELFPFAITVGIDTVRQNPRFEVQRQGGGLDIVRWR